MQAVVQAVRDTVADEHMSILFLDAGADAWVLPFFQIKKLHVLPRPRIREAPLPNGLLHDGESAGLLVLNVPFKPEQETGWKMYSEFSQSDAALYLWKNP